MDEVVRLADINRIKDKSAPIAAKYGLRRMYLFGSHAKGIATKDSDIDLLFEKGEKLSLPGGPVCFRILPKAWCGIRDVFAHQYANIYKNSMGYHSGGCTAFKSENRRNS